MQTSCLPYYLTTCPPPSRPAGLPTKSQRQLTQAPAGEKPGEKGKENLADKLVDACGLPRLDLQLPCKRDNQAEAIHDYVIYIKLRSKRMMCTRAGTVPLLQIIQLAVALE